MELKIPKENIVNIKNHYIVSKQRSGSTLLAFMFATSPVVQVVLEENLYFKFKAKYKKSIFNSKSIILQFVEDAYKFPTHKNYLLNSLPNREIVENILIEYCNYNLNYKEFCNLFNLLFFSKYETNNIHTIINKDIIYQVSVEEVHREDPNVKFVILVRDSVFNINSYIDKGLGTSNIVGQAHIWNNLMDDLYACTNKLPKKNYLIVKYENLINNTSNELMKICEFFDLSFQSRLLNHQNASQFMFDYSRQRMAERGIDVANKPGNKIHESSRNKINKNKVFEHHFKKSEIRKINFITHRNRKRFGYTNEERNYKDIFLISVYDIVLLIKEMIKLKILKFYYKSSYYFKVFFRKINVFNFFN